MCRLWSLQPERPRGDPALSQVEGLAKAEPPAPCSVHVTETLPRDFCSE